MNLNREKCAFMVHGDCDSFCLDIRLEGAIRRVSEFRDLGVITDEDRRFVAQTDWVVGKINTLVSLVNRRQFNPSIKWEIFRAVAFSLVNFANELWAPTNQRDKRKLESFKEGYII